MNVINLAVYKEAKQLKQFRQRVREEKIKARFNYAKKAIPLLDQWQFEDLAGAIHDCDSNQINKKLNELIFDGALLDGIEIGVDVEMVN